MSTPFWDNSTGAANVIIGPGADGPLYATNEWDFCLLSGMRLPGITYVEVASRKRRVQRKSSNGSDGETPTFRGLAAAELLINVEIWTPDQLSLWDSMLPLIFPNPNKDVNKLAALDISHPATHQRGIKAIIVEDIGGPKPGSVKGSKLYTLKCIEYLPENKKSQVHTVTGAVATTAAFKPALVGKNSPPPPSQTDTGPTPAPQPAGGSS